MEEKRCETSAESERENLVKAYSETRGLSEKICETLEPEGLCSANDANRNGFFTPGSFARFWVRNITGGSGALAFEESDGLDLNTTKTKTKQ